MVGVRIVGSRGAGLVACSSRFPRLLATGCALHGASLSLCTRKEKVTRREGEKHSCGAIRSYENKSAPFLITDMNLAGAK